MQTGQSDLSRNRDWKAFRLRKGKATGKTGKIEAPEAEKKRYFEARDHAVEELHQIYERKPYRKSVKLHAQIFEVHAMMLEDDDYTDSVLNMIETQNVNAEYAVAKTGDNFSEMFAAMDDEYFSGKKR